MAALVDYWRACTLFSTWPVAPELGGNTGSDCCVPAEATLPWEYSDAPNTNGFIIYCGVDSRNETRRIITDALGVTAAGFGGDAYLFSIHVSATGTPVPESVRLSPIAWVASCCCTPGPNASDWLFGFDLATRALAADVERFLVAKDNDRGQPGGSIGPVDYGGLLAATRHLAEELGLPELTRGIEIRIASIPTILDDQKNGNEAANGNEVLGVFADDLALIAHKLRNLVVGLGLRNFLTSPEETTGMQRIDVGTTSLPQFRYLAPEHFPPASWPVADVAAPRLGEQFAVNVMLKTLQHGAGLFAVETLPGAGKTAVLRDLTAAILVERALRLVRLGRPESAFIGERNWCPETTGKSENGITLAHATKVHTVSLLREELQGFEMVLAAWDEEGLARGMAAFSETEPFEPGCLPPGSGALSGESKQHIAYRIDSPELLQHLYARLMANRLAPEAVTDAWRAAVASFSDAIAEERRLRRKRNAKFDDFVARGNILQEIDVLEARLATIADRRMIARQDTDTAQAEHAQAVHDLEQAEKFLRLHSEQRPGLMSIVFSLGDNLSEWKVSGRSHALAHEHAARRLVEAEIRLKYRQRTLSSVHAEEQEVSASLTTLHIRAAALKNAQGVDRGEFGDHHPASIDWGNPAVTIEHPAPWSDPVWRHARSRVFSEAVRLHGVFVAANAESFGRNLIAAQAIATNSSSPSVPLEVAEAALGSLFFSAPVLAAPLSGFSTLFSRLQRESLGWVFLDETDRIPPYAAIGAIWRARRTVAFGDTAAPAVSSSLPEGIHRTLRRQFGVDAFCPESSATTQQLVARANRLGCWRRHPDSKNQRVWSGLPITEWRSSEQPHTSATDSKDRSNLRTDTEMP